MSLVTGWRLQIAKARVLFDLWRQFAPLTSGWRERGRTLKAVLQLRAKVRGSRKTYKYVKAGGRYYWDLNVPGWPSQSLNAYLPDAVSMAREGDSGSRLSAALLAITSSCPLRCEHCFEWDSLNKKNGPSTEHWERAVDAIQKYGAGQIHFTGGEPFSQYPRLLALLERAKPKTDFWVLTSGVGLTFDRAQKLKRHGLVGVMISLDDYREAEHDAFRGFKGAYKAALSAARNSADAGLVTAFSICVRSEFAETPLLMESLFQLAELAAAHDIGFIQLLEPKAVGHYAGKDVSLSKDKIEVLEQFYESVNFAQTYAHLPIIAYPGYQQRRVGCFGSGQRYFYADTEGQVHACPFCHQGVGSIFTEDVGTLVTRLRSGSCSRFASYTPTAQLRE